MSPPIERGDYYEAEDIGKYHRTRVNRLLADYRVIQQSNPNKSEVQLIEEGKLKPWPNHPRVAFLGKRERGYAFADQLVRLYKRSTGELFPSLGQNTSTSADSGAKWSRAKTEGLASKSDSLKRDAPPGPV
jgi:hypothetical protein